MNPTTTTTRLSDPVRRKLSATHRRRALTWLLTLTMGLLSAAMVLAGAAMLLDWTVPIRPAWIRIALSLAVLIGFVRAAFWFRKQLAPPSGIGSTANWLDRENPDLEERLATTVELGDREDVSGELLGEVSRQVDDIEIKGEVHRMVRGRGFRPVLIGGAAALVMAGLLWFLCGSNSGVLLDRLVRPWSDRTLTQLPDEAALERHRKGRDLEVSLPVSGKIPGRAKLQQRDADGFVEERWIEIDPEAGAIVSTFPRVEEDFAWRVFAGDDETPWNEVTVYDYPRTENLSLRVVPPAYTGKPERTWDTLPRRLTIPEGSAVSLGFGVDQPLAAATMVEKVKGEDAGERALVPGDEDRFSYDHTLTRSLDAELQLAAEFGDLTSRFPMALVAQPDRKPRVQLEKDTETFALKADETLEVKFRATDDYGIVRAEVVAQLEDAEGNKESFRFPVELGEQTDEKKIEAAFDLDLAQLPIEKGTRLSYQVEVWDRRGETAREESGQIQEAPPAGMDLAELRQAREQIEALRQALASAQQVNNEALAVTGAPPVTGEHAEEKSEPGAETNEDGSRQSPKSEDGTQASESETASPRDGNGQEQQGSETGRLASGESEKNSPSQPASGSPGQNREANDPAALSQQTRDLLDEAAELTAKLPELADGKREPLSRNIGDAQEAVEASRSAEAPAAPLTQAGEHIAEARASLDAVAENMDQQIAEAQARETREQQLEDLRDALLMAQAMVSEAQQQPNGSNGNPNQQGSPNRQGSPKQSQSLAALAGQLGQCQSCAGGIGKPNLDPSVSEAIEQAEAKAEEAQQDVENRDEHLAEVAEEIDQALAALTNQESKTGDKQPPGSGSPSSQGIAVANRMLDVPGGNCGCSGSAPVTVDEFQDYLIAGDGREKQTIAIKAALELIREQAEAARTKLAEVSAVEEKPEDGAEDSPESELPEAFRAGHDAIVASLTRGIEEAEKLRAVSADTPYAFFGLQAKALVEQGFEPAKEGMADGLTLSDPDELSARIQLVDERLRWVLAFLEKSEAQFDEMIELEEIVELTHQFRKMHQITLEDLPLVVGIGGEAGENDKSPYPKLACELSDQQVQEVIAALKLKREVLKRLGELMQDDPNLRARLLAQGEQSKKIYREELTRLRNRQDQLADALAEREQLLEEGAEPTGLPPVFDGMLKRRLLEAANQAATAVGNARIWIPEETPEDFRSELEDRLGELSNAADRFTRTDFRDAAAIETATQKLEAARDLYDSTLSSARRVSVDDEYLENRLDDLEALGDELETCAELAGHLRAGEGDRFLAQFQGELNADTQQVVLGLMNALSQIGGVEDEIDQKIESLETLLTNDLSGSQKRALEALEKEQPKEAEEAKRQAATELESGVKLLDEALLAFLEAQESGESPESRPADPLPDPTESQIAAALKELLRNLEREARGLPETKLGLESQPNLEIKLDWKKTPEEKEQERKEAEQRRQQQKQQAQQAARKAAQAQAMANRRAEAIARGLSRAPALPWKERELKEFEGRNDWNSLPSELQESMTQEFDPSVPAEYRAAIQRYFRAIAESDERE